MKTLTIGRKGGEEREKKERFVGDGGAEGGRRGKGCRHIADFI